MVVVLCSGWRGAMADDTAQHGSRPVALDSMPSPSFAIILGRQRSGTTHLSTVLGQHHCVVNGNEILTNNPVQDTLGAYSVANMSREQVIADPMKFLRAAHGPLCRKHVTDERCGGKCIIVFKLFDIHLRNPLPVILADDTAVIVVERNVGDAFCSWQHARTTGDWGTTPLVHEANGYTQDQYRRCNLQTPMYGQYRAHHVNWFANARRALHKQGKPFVEVPWKASTEPCYFYRVVLPTMYAHLGLDYKGVVIDDPSVAPCA